MNATSSPEPQADETFLSDTEHVPDAIPSEKRDQFRDIQQPAPEVIPPGMATGWTAEEIAQLFDGCFTVLVFANLLLPIGGEHWQIPQEKCLQLGRAWLPIFVKHVPYESKPTWMPDFLLYVTALGATKEVLGPPIAAELRQFRLNGEKARVRAEWQQRNPGKPFPGFTTDRTTKASTATETPSESAEPVASEGAARPSVSGFQSTFATTD